MSAQTAPSQDRAPSAAVRYSEVDPGPLPDQAAGHIAVLVSLNFPDLTEPVADLVRRFTGTALRTLVASDASFEVFDTSQPLPDPTRVAEADGLLILGGGDVDPELYGHDGSAIPNAYGVDRRADADTIKALEAALDAERPVLAICRGAQLVNIAHGGTIVPDLNDYRLHRGGPGEPLFVDERISVTHGSRLSQVVSSERLTVRSGHHQAIAQVADGFVVSATADDGVIEGIEHRDRWILAVQWHPEDPDGPERDRNELFRSFIEAAARGQGRWANREAKGATP